MTEQLTYRIDHQDRTSTFIGSKTRSFGAFKNPHSLMEEGDIKPKIAEAFLPFQTGPIEIVGWGGFSTAIRLRGTQRNYVAVLRDLPTGGRGDLAGLWQHEKTINKKFQPYTLPQQLVITDGIDHNPMVAKVSPEVRGGTLKDLSPLYLFGNPKFLKQYIDFTLKVLKEFRSSGTLIDISGHISGKPLTQLCISLFPFGANNLMLEEGVDQLKLVDCDIKPAIHVFSEAKLSQKIGLLIRAGALGLSIMPATVALFLHRVRDRFLSDKFTTEANPEFSQGFASIIKTLEEFGADYRVLGSFAVVATMQQSGDTSYLSPRRLNMTRRDVDILLLNPQAVDYQKLSKALENIQREFKTCPAISLTIPSRVGNRQKETEGHRQNLLTSETTRIGIDASNNLYFVYLDSYSPIPSHILTPAYQQYDKIQFKTLEPGGVAGFALTRGGAIKFKDRDKINRMLELAQNPIPTEFLDWAKRIRTKYPTTYHNFLVREWISYLTGGFIGGGQLTNLRHKLSRIKSFKTDSLNIGLTEKRAA